MAIFKVKKRNGSIVSFESEKITKAIKSAIIAAGGDDFSALETITKEVLNRIEQNGESIPEVEVIQDIVEETLIKEGHDSVAKKYILYREQRRQKREDAKVTVEVGNTMEEYLNRSDWRVNANANSGYSLG